MMTQRERLERWAGQAGWFKISHPEEERYLVFLLPNGRVVHVRLNENGEVKEVECEK